MFGKKGRGIACGITLVFASILACILIPVAGVLVAAIQRGLLEAIPWQSINPLRFVLFLGIITIAIFSILFLALVLLSLYSSITITPQGIEYRTVLSNGIIQNDEISYFSSPRLIRSLRVLVIQRNGSNLISPKGLLFQIFHGILLGFNKPVIILWENAKEIERQIIRSGRGQK